MKLFGWLVGVMERALTVCKALALRKAPSVIIRLHVLINLAFLDDAMQSVISWPVLQHFSRSSRADSSHSWLTKPIGTKPTDDIQTPHLVILLSSRT